jgi:polyhydroxybutyrate depolymerase
MERSYVLQVPASYNPGKGLPLVVMFHGGGGTARAAIWETGWAEKAEKEGFLIVFPNAMPPDPSQPSSFARNPQLWNDGSDRFYPGQKAPDDVTFINAVLNDLVSRLTVDASRIFATGFSNGASMSFRVGAELSKRIAAIAPVAGACWLESLLLERPVPMCYITGKADPLNPIEGGVPKLATGIGEKIRSKPKPPVGDSILKWAKALGCPPMPASMSEANGVRTETYGPCHEDAEVVYITVDGLGHTWAGGKSLLPESMVGAYSDKIKATDVIWEFFQRHPMK